MAVRQEVLLRAPTLGAPPAQASPVGPQPTGAWELSRSEASGQAFSSGEDLWGPFQLCGSGIGDIVTQQLKMSQQL